MVNTSVVLCFCLMIVHDHPGLVPPRRATGSTNVGEQLPTGQLSVVPWRRTGVKYTNNEAYFDVVEEIDVIIDKSGTAVSGRRVEPRGCSMVYMPPHWFRSGLVLWSMGSINRTRSPYSELFSQTSICLTLIRMAQV